MSAFLYGAALQWKLDIRSKALLITCYLVPLLFFAVMGGIFTSLMLEAKSTLIQSMTVMGVSMGALVGLPPSLTEIYGSDIKKVYKANGVPLYLGLFTISLSAFLHLMLMCLIIYIAAPIAFDAQIPERPLCYFIRLSIFIGVSLSLGSILGLSVKNQSKLTMVSQIAFLPSIMLSGIMFPAGLLPRPLAVIGSIFPAAWGYRLLTGDGSVCSSLFPLAVIFAVCAAICVLALRRLQSE